jgi:hypothetical protein
LPKEQKRRPFCPRGHRHTSQRARVASIMDRQHVPRDPHPLYSLHINPCDFWLFGAVKHAMPDIEFNSTEQIMCMVGNSGMTSPLRTCNVCSKMDYTS